MCQVRATPPKPYNYCCRAHWVTAFYIIWCYLFCNRNVVSLECTGARVVLGCRFVSQAGHFSHTVHCTEPLSRNHCCCGKTISITYSECLSVASVIQYATRMRHISSSVTCLALQHFPTLSRKPLDFRREKKFLNLKCLLIFAIFSDWNTPHSKKNWARYYHKCSRTLVFRYVPVIAVRL